VKENARLNPKDVYTPDDFLHQRMLDYEQAEEPKVRPHSPDLLIGILIGSVIMLPVYMVVFVVIGWLF